MQLRPPPFPPSALHSLGLGRACPIAHGAFACDAHAGTCGQREGSERSRPASVESSSAGRCTWHRSRHFWHSGEPWENICPASGPTTSCVLHSHSRSSNPAFRAEHHDSPTHSMLGSADAGARPGSHPQPCSRVGEPQSAAGRDAASGPSRGPVAAAVFHHHHPGALLYLLLARCTACSPSPWLSTTLCPREESDLS